MLRLSYMSIDYFLHNKNSSEFKITEENLNSLKFDYKDVTVDDDGNVQMFVLLDDSGGEYEFHVTNNGTLYSLTYDYSEENYSKYLEMVKSVAETLGLTIEDPQTGETAIEPTEFINEQRKEIAKIQNKVVSNLDLDTLLSDALDAEYTDFIKNIEAYEASYDTLVEKYVDMGYFIDHVIHDQNVNSEMYLCSFVVSLPTIMPPVEHIVLTDLDEPGVSYLVNIDILKDILSPDRIVESTDPVLHYKVEDVEDPDILARLKELAMRIESSAIEE